MLASWRRIPETYRPMHSPIVSSVHSKYFRSGYQRRNKGGTKINRSFYFIHILSKSGYATIIIIYKSSRWTVFFFQVSLAETRTGSFSEESRCSGARNKFIILPVSLRLQQNILNISTSLRKYISEHLFSPEQLPVAAFDGSSQLRCSAEKSFLEGKLMQIWIFPYMLVFIWK